MQGSIFLTVIFADLLTVSNSSFSDKKIDKKNKSKKVQFRRTTLLNKHIDTSPKDL